MGTETQEALISLGQTTTPQEPSSGPSRWGLLLWIMLQELQLTLQAMSMLQETQTGGLNGNTNVGSGDLFVVKYNSSGAKQWTKQLGTSVNNLGRGVATDSSGQCLCGWIHGGLDGNTERRRL